MENLHSWIRIGIFIFIVICDFVPNVSWSPFFSFLHLLFLLVLIFSFNFMLFFHFIWNLHFLHFNFLQFYFIFKSRLGVLKSRWTFFIFRTGFTISFHIENFEFFSSWIKRIYQWYVDLITIKARIVIILVTTVSWCIGLYFSMQNLYLESIPSIHLVLKLNDVQFFSLPSTYSFHFIFSHTPGRKF